MNQTKTLFAVLLFLLTCQAQAQLGFCNGSKGEPIFTENFGNGTTYGPALPTGTTTYPFVTGAPNDGQYTLYYHSALYTTWHYSLDHTPDATNGPNGKMLLMNANAVTSGDFYKKTVSGLCINTTFEFSAWLMNVYNPNTNYCGAGQIPINVRFEIWNATETVLLGSGNTGNILGSPAPLWQQFALVFTTANETSVVLKMKNNGLGGCGNDLAIDDISFSACGDLTTVSSPLVAGSVYSSCNNPTSIQLNAATAGGTPYFYQWQTSTDNVNWTDIASATNPSYTTPNLTSIAYFRVKAAQDAANLSNSYCSTLSNVFTVDVLPSPNPATANGNHTICSTDAIPALSVTPPSGAGVNWYDAATGGNLVQANSASYTPTAAGTYYAETYNTTSNCIGSPRTAVSLTIVAQPTATISGTTSICSGNTAAISFSGTPNAIVTYTVNGGTNQTIALNNSGSASLTTAVLTSNTTYALVSAADPNLATCTRTLSGSAIITVNSSPTASISAPALVCSGSSVTVTFVGTPNAIVAYKVNGGASQSITLDGAGNASITTNNVAANMTYLLVSAGFSGPNGCSQPLSQSITITVVALLTASINASPLTVCSGQTSAVSFSGTPNAIVTYTINSGANQTITLNASGTASFVTTALTSNTTYTLVSAAAAALNSCSSNLSGSVAVSVNALPNASIATNAPVCYGTSATVTFTGTPNSVVTYSSGSGNQTITLDASGSASITIPSVTATTNLNLVSTTGTNGCTRALSQSISVSATALPTATISANPATVCSNQPSTINFSGTPNAVVTYTVNGGANQTTTLNASGTAAVTTSPLAANATYQLASVTLAGCGQSVSGSATVSVNPTPNVTYTGNSTYCNGDSVLFNLSSNVAGTTFGWTVSQSGTTGATSGSGNQIAQTVTLLTDAIGTVTYTVTPVANGCTGNSISITATIYPLPVPKITDGVICTTGQPSNQSYTLDTQLSASDHTFQWFFGTNQIPGAFGSTYNAMQTGTYSVIATNAAGCVSAAVSAVVGEMAQGESLEVHQSEAFSDNPTITVTVIGGGGPFSYQLDDGVVQTSNVFHDVWPGTHTITVTDGYCTYLTSTATIINYPHYFTPNEDGIHDTWNITGISNSEIFIFDRYGKLIKQISTDGLGWDGTYNGRQLPSTDYWFTIDYAENGKNKTFRAHFSLKR